MYNGTQVLLRKIKNFERLELERSRVNKFAELYRDKIAAWTILDLKLIGENF